MREKKAYEYIVKNVKGLAELKDANKTNKYSRYDWFINDNFQDLVIEYKDRSKALFYPAGTMIEKKKLVDMWLGEKVTHYYCVTNAGHLWFWDINKLREEKYDFRWHEQSCPTTSYFKNKDYISKTVGDIDWDKAYKVIDLSTGKYVEDIEGLVKELSE